MTASPSISSRRRAAFGALGLLAVFAAACAGTAGQTGIDGASASPAGVASPAPPSAGDAPSPSVPPSPEATAGSGPPAAALAGALGGPVAGDLGSFSWDALVSDSPWIVERTGGAVTAGQRLRIRFDDADQVAWAARWAPIRRRQPGTPQSAGSGGNGRITVDAPSEAGPWTLQLQATFGDGRRAVWYWRVEVDG